MTSLELSIVELTPTQVAQNIFETFQIDHIEVSFKHFNRNVFKIFLKHSSLKTKHFQNVLIHCAISSQTS